MSITKDEANQEAYLDKHPTLEVCEECNRIVHNSDMRLYGQTTSTMKRLCERCIASREIKSDKPERAKKQRYEVKLNLSGQVLTYWCYSYSKGQALRIAIDRLAKDGGMTRSYLRQKFNDQSLNWSSQIV